MRQDTIILDRAFAARDALKKVDVFLEGLVAFDVDEVSCRQSMLSDQDGALVLANVVEEFGCLPFEGGDEFGAHASDTIVPLHPLQCRGNGMLQKRATDAERHVSYGFIDGNACGQILCNQKVGGSIPSAGTNLDPSIRGGAVIVTLGKISSPTTTKRSSRLHRSASVFGVDRRGYIAFNMRGMPRVYR